MPSQIEEVLDSSMSTHKSLRLLYRLEPPHPSLPHPSRSVQLLCSIILILLSTVDRLGHQLPMSNTIAPQLVGHDLSGLAIASAAYH